MADIINIDDFTQGTINGKGVFDVLMTTVKAHLKEEFDAGRIRATDYSNAYVQLMSVVLAESAQFVISKTRLEAEIKLLESQTRGEDASTEIKQYQLDCILPKEANNLLLAGILTGAQTSAAVQQTNNMIEQHKGIVLENQTKKYQVKELLPLEKVKLETTNRMVDAQISGIMTDNEMKTFQMDFILPNELEIKESQLAIAEKEVLIKGEQLLITKFELENKLPADVGLVTAQDELYTQKAITEKAQTDESVVGAGSVIDTNNKLLEEQSKVYLRNAQQTAAKLLIDTWNVRHSSDPDGNLENAANKLQDADIGAAITRMNANLS